MAVFRSLFDPSVIADCIEDVLEIRDGDDVLSDGDRMQADCVPESDFHITEDKPYGSIDSYPKSAAGINTNLDCSLCPAYTAESEQVRTM